MRVMRVVRLCVCVFLFVARRSRAFAQWACGRFGRSFDTLGQQLRWFALSQLIRLACVV